MMSKKLFILIMFLSFPVYSATWKKIKSSAVFQYCPTNYILVSALSPYTKRDFCVAKYEMKNDGYGTAVSQPGGTLWVSVNRPTARSACQALGGDYDLISNDQWQTIARDITGVADNWSTGTVYSGELNRGHSDSVPADPIVASSDDNDACFNTGQTCSSTVWRDQRRTHKLSNGNVIWDFAGNLREWVTNDNNVVNGADGYMSTMNSGIRQSRYGAATGTFCGATATSPYCGMGYSYFNYAVGAAFRGGGWDVGVNSGIFYVNLANAGTYTQAGLGFRCIFSP